jgi:putative ABC transport system permease protein
MLLDMLMLSQGIRESFRELFATSEYSVRVTPAGTLPFQTDATLRDVDALSRRLAEAPEVAGVTPVLGSNLLAAGDSVRVFALGVEPDRQGVYRLLEGRSPSAPDELLVGGQVSEALAVGIGDTLRLRTGAFLGGAAGPRASARTFRVVGRAEFLYASAEERPVAVPLGALGELTGREDRASFLMLRLRDGLDPDSAVANLRGRFPGVGLASVGELLERAREQLSYFRQLAYILGTVSLIVTLLLVGTVTAVSVSDRYGTIAALRAMGISRRTILLGLGLETLLLCAAGTLLGLGLGLAAAEYLETILADFPGVPRAVRFFVLDPTAAALALGGTVLGGLLAAQLPAWRAASLEIAPTLHEEEL